MQVKHQPDSKAAGTEHLWCFTVLSCAVLCCASDNKAAGREHLWCLTVLCWRLTTWCLMCRSGTDSKAAGSGAKASLTSRPSGSSSAGGSDDSQWSIRATGTAAARAGASTSASGQVKHNTRNNNRGSDFTCHIRIHVNDCYYACQHKQGALKQF